jgi:hypothetical protein
MKYIGASGAARSTEARAASRQRDSSVVASSSD